jgi:hypothetical protein
MMNTRNAVDVEPVFVYYADEIQFVSKSESSCTKRQVMILF